VISRGDGVAGAACSCYRRTTDPRRPLPQRAPWWCSRRLDHRLGPQSRFCGPERRGALGNGYPLLVLRRIGRAPGRRVAVLQSWHQRNKVARLQQRWTSDTVDLHPGRAQHPDGVNDFCTAGPWLQRTVQDYEQQYAALLDETRRACRACI